MEIANKVGAAEITSRVVEDLKDENEQFRKMVMDCIEKVRGRGCWYNYSLTGSPSQLHSRGPLHVIIQQTCTHMFSHSHIPMMTPWAPGSIHAHMHVHVATCMYMHISSHNGPPAGAVTRSIHVHATCMCTCMHMHISSPRSSRCIHYVNRCTCGHLHVHVHACTCTFHPTMTPQEAAVSQRVKDFPVYMYMCMYMWPLGMYGTCRSSSCSRQVTTTWACL